MMPRTPNKMLKTQLATKAYPATRKKKQGRNERCACGSGRKYKTCHGR